MAALELGRTSEAVPAYDRSADTWPCSTVYSNTRVRVPDPPLYSARPSVAPVSSWMYGAYSRPGWCETSTGFENSTRTSTVEPAPYAPSGEADETDRARGRDVSLVAQRMLAALFAASATTMRPSGSDATATGFSNWPGRSPRVPNEPACVPSRPSMRMPGRLLSDTRMRPSAEAATPVYRCDASSGPKDLSNAPSGPSTWMVPDRSRTTMRPSGKDATAIGPDSMPDDEPASVVEKINVPFTSNTRTASPAAATIWPDGPAATAFGLPTPAIVLLYEPSALYSWMRPLLRSSSDIMMRPSAGATAMPVGLMNEEAAEKSPRMIWRDRLPFGSNMRTERPSVLRSSRIRARIEPSGAAAAARGASRWLSPPRAVENLPASS